MCACKEQNIQTDTEALIETKNPRLEGRRTGRKGRAGLFLFPAHSWDMREGYSHPDRGCQLVSRRASLAGGQWGSLMSLFHRHKCQPSTLGQIWPAKGTTVRLCVQRMSQALAACGAKGCCVGGDCPVGVECGLYPPCTLLSGGGGDHSLHPSALRDPSSLSLGSQSPLLSWWLHTPPGS